MISDITCSGGGPLIALPSEIAADWRGTLPPIGANVPDGWRWGDSPYIECDYDRAFGNIEKIGRFGYDYFGVLGVNNSRAFVFTCEQVISFKENENGGMLIGNFHEYDKLDQFLATVDDNSWTLNLKFVNLKKVSSIFLILHTKVKQMLKKSKHMIMLWLEIWVQANTMCITKTQTTRSVC